MTKHHIIKRLPRDVLLNQRIKPRNSELRSKVIMPTSRTGSSRLLKSHSKKSIIIKVNRTDISSLDQYTSLAEAHNIRRTSDMLFLLRCQIPYHPVANQCYSQFIPAILWIECYSKEQPAIIIMQISHIRE